jgi:ABC-type transport system substrate-binding protein
VANLAGDVPVPSPDGRTYRFRLRPKLRFSDGAPVTPEDVRASLARLLAFGDPGSYDELDAIPGAVRCKDQRLRALELLSVHTGTIGLDVAEHHVEVPAGDSAWFDATHPHAYKNPGAQAATFTLVVLEPA